MKVKVKLNELLDADPRFISLVKAGANRLPIRIIKAEKGEVDMGGIDLSNASRLFKVVKAGDAAPGTVSGIVVMKDANFEAVKKAVADAGFKVDVVKELEGGTAMFVQADKPEEQAHVVRLSEHALVTIKSFTPYAEKLAANCGFLGDEAKKNEFFIGSDIVGKAMSHTLSTVMAEAPTVAQKNLKEINTYLETLQAGVPLAAFKLDKSLADIYKAATPAKNPDDPEDDPAQGGDGGADESTEMPDGYDKKKWDSMSASDRKTVCTAARTAAKADKAAKAAKAATPAKKDGGSMNPDGYLEMPPNTDKAVWDLMSEDMRQQYAAAAAKVTGSQGGSPTIESLVSNAVKTAADALKADLQKVHKDEIDGLTQMVKNLTLAQTGLIAKYEELTAKLGLTAKKTEEIDHSLRGTVLAGEPSGDPDSAWLPGEKSAYGDDYIVDTAMQARTKKYDKGETSRSGFAGVTTARASARAAA